MLILAGTLLGAIVSGVLVLVSQHFQAQRVSAAPVRPWWKLW